MFEQTAVTYDGPIAVKIGYGGDLGFEVGLCQIYRGVSDLFNQWW